MPNLQKIHDRELRKSADYIAPSGFWLKMILLLSIIAGIIASEMLTKGKMSPYFEGGWLTYLIHEIISTIREYVSQIRSILSEAVSSLKF